MGLGFCQGLLEEAAIADRPGAAAIATPLGGKGLNRPAEVMGRPADGLISATGTAMEQQMDGPPAATALQEGGGDALLGPGEITATGGDDDDGAMNNNRRRQ